MSILLWFSGKKQSGPCIIFSHFFDPAKSKLMPKIYPAPQSSVNMSVLLSVTAIISSWQPQPGRQWRKKKKKKKRIISGWHCCHMPKKKLVWEKNERVHLHIFVDFSFCYHYLNSCNHAVISDLSAAQSIYAQSRSSSCTRLWEQDASSGGQQTVSPARVTWMRLIERSRFIPPSLRCHVWVQLFYDTTRSGITLPVSRHCIKALHVPFVKYTVHTGTVFDRWM